MYKGLLFPTDGSLIAAAAVRAGIEFARHIGTEVLGVFVAPAYEYPDYADGLPVNRYPEEEHKVAMREASGNIQCARDSAHQGRD